MTRTRAADFEDGELLVRARSGDAAAMQALLAELSPKVRRHGRKLCRHEADAMDVLQDTLLAVASKLETLEHDAALSSWVYTLARTACSRRRRGLAHRVTTVDAAAVDEAPTYPDSASSSPEELLEAARVGRAIARALCSLPKAHREVLVLREIAGLEAEDTAERLGITVAALKSRLHRARAALRDAFERLDPAERDVEADVWSCDTDD